jgi:hypothetical protein
MERKVIEQVSDNVVAQGAKRAAESAGATKPADATGDCRASPETSAAITGEEPQSFCYMGFEGLLVRYLSGQRSLISGVGPVSFSAVESRIIATDISG